MAATRGTVQGFSKIGGPQNKIVTRLGNGSVKATADTWRTFTTVEVAANGSGYVSVKRDGKILHYFTFGPE